jgi:hypothetical protein
MFSALFEISSGGVSYCYYCTSVQCRWKCAETWSQIAGVLWMVGILFTLVTMIACSSSAFKSIFRLARSPVPRAACSAHSALRTFSIKGAKAADDKEFVITPRNVDYGAWY